MKNEEILIEAEVFFFEAMQAGYAAQKSEKMRIAELRGYKAIQYENGNYRLLDIWCTTQRSTKSAGTTTIWFENNPVWVMQYYGDYDEVAIPVLKEALRFNYTRAAFRGGRGPYLFQSNSFNYINIPRKDTFGHFEGREEVYSSPELHNLSGNFHGFHEYRGGLLL